MIFYIHGFNSGIDASKIEYLSATFNQLVIGIEYNSGFSFEENFKYLKEQVEENIKNKEEQIIFIGTSLGGFYANQLSNSFKSSKCILINPALYPFYSLKKYLGRNINFKTNQIYLFSIDTIFSYNIDLNLNKNSLILLSEKDEVIDSFRTKEEFQSKTKVIMYPNGEHRFNQYELAKKDILKFING